MWIIMHIIF
ncbi:uncharacterized protein CELE_F08B12.11 [Caenorhabditis elegans]|uniref:Uncharacterized protein n=1 Tax=Caenorhabditis elegans TaxID=6239 RepID=A0A2K5AU11_CAEEL|nr:Uncharacterized protein CELE_F08B12.11 [Caenorhabditis elegans]SPC48663.2 Uncharacterized protein CELE_F08B12.11 [Caenorhabditis elegans]|eukprot:NP_001348802.2 Uncharacterized protein CELE_F08B12.11 [Caenorhabditis elegans]